MSRSKQTPSHPVPAAVQQPAKTVPMTLGGDRASRVQVPTESVEQFKALGWVEAKD